MSNPESGRFRSPDVVFRDPYVGYQEFKDLKNDLKDLKKVVCCQNKIIKRLVESVDRLSELEYD